MQLLKLTATMPEEDTPLLGYIGMCGLKRCFFLATLFRDGVSILVIVVANRHVFCTLVFNWDNDDHFQNKLSCTQ